MDTELAAGVRSPTPKGPRALGDLILKNPDRDRASCTTRGSGELAALRGVPRDSSAVSLSAPDDSPSALPRGGGRTSSAASVCASILMGLDPHRPRRCRTRPAYVYAFSHAATTTRGGAATSSRPGPLRQRDRDDGPRTGVGRPPRALRCRLRRGRPCTCRRAWPTQRPRRRMVAVVYAFSVQTGVPLVHVLLLVSSSASCGRAGAAAYAVAGLLVGFFLLVKFSPALFRGALGVGCCLVGRPVVPPAAWP